MYARRRRTILLAVLLIVVLGLLVGRVVDRRMSAGTVPLAPTEFAEPPPDDLGTPTPSATSTRTPKAGRPPTRDPDARVGRSAAAPARGGVATARFDYAGTAGPVLGAAGTLRRFKVAVEAGGGVSDIDFANAVDRILGDPRSWTAGRHLRLQRVPPGRATEFTVFLASPATSERMCADGGLATDGYTSCRLRGQVIINLDRWENAVPNYGAPLATYQAYAVNHEVGHELGHGHEACPGAGLPAPVMQQQTYGLKGCVANAWPYIDGRRYAGEPIA